MSTKPLKTTVGIIAAGKLTLVSHTALADFTDGSKASQLSITEGGLTFLNVRQPDGSINGTTTQSRLLDIDENSSSSSSSKSAATLFSGTVNLDLFQGDAGEYITESVIVSAFNGKDNGPLDVYLVISPSTNGSGWPSTAAGAVLIDQNNFEVIGKATIVAVESTPLPFGGSSLVSDTDGVLAIGANSTVGSPGLYPPVNFTMPIERQNFNSDFFSTGQLHMQAVAFPAGSFDWANATVSPLYSFVLSESGSGTSSK